MTLQKTSHTFREAAQAVGIGMQASGSYVCAKFNSDAYAALAKVNLSELRFSKEKAIAVTESDREKGKGGTVARIVNVSECGKYVRYADKTVMHTDVVKMTVYTLAGFVESTIKAGVIATVARLEARQVVEGSEITGYVYGSLSESYSSLVYVLNGKVQIKDIETKANEYNAHELVVITSSTEDENAKLAERLRKAAGCGEVEAVAKVKKAKSTKAKSTKAKDAVSASA